MGPADRPAARCSTPTRSPKVIAVVHAETSTGVRNDVAPLGAGKGDALLLVDCVTSLGGIPVEIDEWGVDVAYSGTQKCLGVPPGPVAGHRVATGRVERLRRASRSRGTSTSHDRRLRRTGDGARTYHHTAPISMIFALHAGLGALLDEGLEASWARHAECGAAAAGRASRARLRAVRRRRATGCPSSRPCGCPTASTRPRCAGALLERYGIEIGGGLGAFAGKVWRIGCMGHTARLAQRHAAARRARRGCLPIDDRAVLRAARRAAPAASAATSPQWQRGAPAQRATGSLKWEPQRIPGQPDVGRATARRSPCAAAPASASASSAPATASASSSTGSFAGEINLNVVQRGPFQSAYVGYWIDEAHAGNGYMPEARRRRCCGFALRGAAPAPHADRDHPPQHGQPPGRREARASARRASPCATSRSTARGRTTSATPSPPRSGTSAATSCSTTGS